MQELVRNLLVWAVSVSPYPLPEALPALETISHQDLVTAVCGGEQCNALAYYDHHTATIYIDQTLNLEDSTMAKSFLLHELVHYLQDASGKMASSPLPCEQYLALEREAYQIQQRYLTTHQIMAHQIDTAIRLLSTLCPVED